ncbi:uncharacterized protein BDZ99DRAFT_521534 [Mytilinidion resinicola]|uniref:Mitochondrial outer membrane protein n=1 Tax=Mytilinidion resinicola TaxID=574789 RepID=A0A6A6YKK0_9PEZI|nr:uncharacterized protein BDZ99DRAFT_521534 [Mytilinidion resinicola]KAF2809068.1 hypothetical protein BDZ99DRAFT_521534 [Mytilinidion resinicola]
MPSEDRPHDEKSQPPTRSPPKPSIFTVPAPIKRLFDRFPLTTYPANELPARSPRNRHQNVLYIFATPSGAVSGAPSYNPSCLKWQTYLKFSDVDFRLVASNNHASPSGALPFLLPSTHDTAKPASPIPSGKLQKWALEKRKRRVEEPEDMRYEAYLSLLDHLIRKAWLYTLYLTPNFTSIAEPLYVLPISTNSMVRLTTAYELRKAAEIELLKNSVVIDAETLYTDAEEALGALETVLGDQDWFFGAKEPGLFDASVFAYTHLLLDAHLGNGWAEPRLRNSVLARGNLVAHRDRILAGYYPGA